MVGKFFASLPSLQAKRSVTKCSAAIPPYTSHCERNEVQRGNPMKVHKNRTLGLLRRRASSSQ